MYVGTDTAGALRRLEQQRVVAGSEGQRLTDAAGALNESALRPVGCGWRAPSTVIALDAALGAKGPADAGGAGIVSIAATQTGNLEAGVEQRGRQHNGVDDLRQRRTARGGVASITTSISDANTFL